MSKSGSLYMKLEEQAISLGFCDVDEAINNGYEIVGTELKPTIDLLRTRAHEEWLKEKEDSIKKLKAVIKFIEEGEV